MDTPPSKVRGAGRAPASTIRSICSARSSARAGEAFSNTFSAGAAGGRTRRGAASGDLYVVVHIREHAVFARDGDDLFCEMPVSFVIAALGGEINVPTLEGKASIKVPAGTQNGTVFKLRGKGMPHLRGSGQGQLLVRAVVEVPTKLTPGQRRKLEDFAESCGDQNAPMARSFLERAKEFFS